MSAEETVVETLPVREAVGVFRTGESLRLAIDRLLTAGFDRSDIDLLGDRAAVYRRIDAVTVPAEELADIPDIPRSSIVTRDDRNLILIAVFQTLFIVGAFAGGTMVVGAGGSVPTAFVVAAIVGILLGLVGVTVMRSRLKRFDERVEDNLAAGGIVVWVRVRNREEELHALDLLGKSGGDAVRVHEVMIDKRLKDLPLATVQPDPLLERLND